MPMAVRVIAILRFSTSTRPAALISQTLQANGTKTKQRVSRNEETKLRKTGFELGLSRLERVTGIEPTLSAWEAVPSGPVT